MIKKLRTEGDFIKVNEWLTPLSWLYGLGVGFRNWLFEIGVKKSREFPVPVISVGNITVGGSGKTPHVEYLVRLLKDQMKVAVLSRGYKRRSHGYHLAKEGTKMKQIGDEPYQMHIKFPDVYVAVDKKRCHGIDRLLDDDATRDTEVVVLDDAYQHRYVKPGINILLTDYHRLIVYDKLLPAGRLREPLKGKDRADIVIVTKCPRDLKPMEFRVLTKVLDLYPYQELFFTTMEYGQLTPLFPDTGAQPQERIRKDEHVLLVTGIASPQSMIQDLKVKPDMLETLTFADHHNFKKKDVRKINEMFSDMPEPKIIVTTEKDAVRLMGLNGLSDEVRKALYAQPIKVRFMGKEQQEIFNQKIKDYVRKD